MTKPKLTPWFPGTVKPVRPGVYERKTETRCGTTFSRWNGRRWHYGSPLIKVAAGDKAESNFPNLPWRGLAEKP